MTREQLAAIYSPHLPADELAALVAAWPDKGFVLPRNADPSPSPRPWSDEDAETVVELKAKGWTDYKIGILFGRSDSSVKSVRKRMQMKRLLAKVRRAA